MDSSLPLNAEERTALHRLVIDHINDGVLFVDLEAHITFVNRRVQELTGYAAAELLGRPVSMLLTPNALQEYQERYRLVVHEGVDRPFFYETEVARKDGTSVWIEVNSTAILHDGKSLGG